MPSPTALRRSPHERVRPWIRTVRPLHILTALALAAALVTMRPLLDRPHLVPRITFQNPTPYGLGIEVTDSDHDSWMPVGTARRRGSTATEEIYDVGDVWVFRFHAQGKTTSELRLTRATLERARWHVDIPEAIGDELMRIGAPPPP
jgi:hypothetical protein